MVVGDMTIKMRNRRGKVPLPNLTSLVFMSSIMCTWVVTIRVEVLPPDFQAGICLATVTTVLMALLWEPAYWYGCWISEVEWCWDHSL